MNILFIEDEDVARVGPTAALTSEGHTVDVADDADRAVEMMRAKAYDLLLLDIMLPAGEVLRGTSYRETGKELLLALRRGGLGELKTHAEVPVVVITAVADLSVTRSLEQAGVQLLLQKPMDPEDMMQHINSVGDKLQRPKRTHQ